MRQINPFEHRYAGIYKFTNKSNGKIYIGQSVNIYNRYCHHRGLYTKSVFANALKKYGFNGFDFEVLERVDDVSLLDLKEKYWLDFYGSYDRNKGYNVSQFSNSIKGLKRPLDAIGRTAAWHKGKKRSQVTSKRISASRKGRASTEAELAHLQNLHRNASARQLKQIAQIDLHTNNIIRIWDRVDDIVEDLNICKNQIRQTCQGRHWSSVAQKYYPKLSYAGYRWRYIHLGEIIPPHPDCEVKVSSKGKPKAINQIDVNTGNILKVWRCAIDIKNELGYPVGSIQAHCRGYRLRGRAKRRYPLGPCFKGFVWKYEEEIKRPP